MQVIDRLVEEIKLAEKQLEEKELDLKEQQLGDDYDGCISASSKTLRASQVVVEHQVRLATLREVISWILD